MKDNNNMKDQKFRSWTKSFTWRFIGIVILLPLTYIFTGKWESAAAVTLSFHLIRMILYYFHERLWEGVSWGRQLNDSKLPFYASLTILVISFLIIIILFRNDL